MTGDANDAAVMDKTDRELLELAAKAAGLSGEWSKTIGGWDCLVLSTGGDPWQPLHDDGDALRLAVKLRIDVIHNEPQDNGAWVMAGDWECVEDVDGEGNRAAATRRAIVRAAAAIGESMQWTR